MSNTTIKKIDLSQIRYEPKEGEVVYNTDEETKGCYVYHDGSWMKLNTENSGLNLGLYDLNKQIIDQLPILSEKELSDKKAVINQLHEKFNNEYYMLYGKEMSYFTLFKIANSKFFGDEVIECLNNVGDVKCIDMTEPGDAIEIWIQSETQEITCLYLFPYDTGLVVVGG
jgi:hypothetical protein